MSLYHCEANGVFGRFGDWVWARSRTEAEIKFLQHHGVKPTRIEKEK